MGYWGEMWGIRDYEEVGIRNWKEKGDLGISLGDRVRSID